jgi:hypothetical protein
MSRLLLIIVVLAVLASCAAPPFINQVKTLQAGNNLVISWNTVRPCKCTVLMCQDELCTWSKQEPEFGTLHQFVVPAGMTDKISVECLEKSGRKATYPLLNDVCPAR